MIIRIYILILNKDVSLNTDVYFEYTICHMNMFILNENIYLTRDIYSEYEYSICNMLSSRMNTLSLIKMFIFNTKIFISMKRCILNMQYVYSTKRYLLKVFILNKDVYY